VTPAWGSHRYESTLDARRPEIVESMRNTAARCDEDKLITEIRVRLSQHPSVRSTHFLCRNSSLSVWVGIRDHDRSARYAVYELEDRIPQQFPNVKVDFHVVPISPGSSLEAFIAASRPGVRCSAIPLITSHDRGDERYSIPSL
jgi:hypothetical protein